MSSLYTSIWVTIWFDRISSLIVFWSPKPTDARTIRNAVPIVAASTVMNTRSRFRRICWRTNPI